MAMGKRREERQGTLFVATDRLPKTAGHPFYQRLNGLLAEAGFDAWIEGRCRPYYEIGRDPRAAVDRARGLLPNGAGGLFRGDRQPAWDRLALCRQPGASAVLGAGVGRAEPGPFDVDEHAEAAAAGGLRGGVPVRAVDHGREGAAGGP